MTSPTTTAYTSGDVVLPLRTSLEKPNKQPSAPPRSSLAPTEIDAEPLISIARLPLEVQVAFRRKFLGIIALQFVGLTIGIAFLEATSPDWLQSAIENSSVYTGLSLVTVALLVALHFVRDRFPFNWAVLTLLTIVLAFVLAGVDSVLEFPLVVFNFVFLCVVEITMVVLAGWTGDATHTCRLPFGWKASTTEEEDSDRRLASLFLTGLVGYVVACVLLIIAWCFIGLNLPFGTVLVSFAVQLLVGLRLQSQIRSLSRKLVTADAYASGVIYLYADVLVAVVAAVIAFFSVLLRGDASAMRAVGCTPEKTLKPQDNGQPV